MESDIKRIKLSPGMTDSHFHLYHMEKRGMKAFDIINRCFEEGLEFAVDIGINADNFKARTATRRGHPGTLHRSRLLPLRVHESRH